jgi:hypothetical protein
MVTQRWPLIVQQEKLLRLAVLDYIDRIVDRRGLRQRVITQPRPKPERGDNALGAAYAFRSALYVFRY